MKYIEITLKKSIIGTPHQKRAIVKGLGLRRINQTVVRDNVPAIRGMVRKVIQMVSVKEVNHGSK